VTTGTTTISTVSGFTPAASASGYQAKKARRFVGEMLLKRTPPMREAGGAMGSGYPTTVRCKETIVYSSTSTKTITASSTVTTAATPTNIVYASPSTISTTTTIVPPHMSVTTVYVYTAISSTTTTGTSTTTVTSTNTNTILAPTATFYAACDTNNIIGTAGGGQTISDYGVYYTGDDPQVTANSAYDCCVQCQTASKCTFSAYYPSYNQCYLHGMDISVCDGSVSAATYEVNTGGTPRFYSDGACGQINYQPS